VRPDQSEGKCHVCLACLFQRTRQVNVTVVALKLTQWIPLSLLMAW